MANTALSNLNLGNPPVTILAMAPLDLARWLKVIVQDRHIVYVEVDDGALPTGWQEMGTRGIPIPTLPPFPPQHVGQSNYMGLSVANTATGRRTEWVRKESLRFINSIDVYHGISFDYASIRKVRRVTNGYQSRYDDRLWVVQIPVGGSWTLALMKVVSFPGGLSSNPLDNDGGQIKCKHLQQEILMHQQGAAGAPSVVPAFIGLVTEPGRGVVGFLSEYVEDAVNIGRVLHLKAVNDMVRYAVEMLHNEARVAHNDLHDENMIIKRDGSRIYIIDFEFALDLRVPGLDFAASIMSDNLIWQIHSGLPSP